MNVRFDFKIGIGVAMLRFLGEYGPLFCSALGFSILGAKPARGDWLKLPKEDFENSPLAMRCELGKK